ncbi:phosphinothricin acetyltransferase [Sanguibacter antarcticus]|uniref:Phosphinothricin acetyltransferase n=2 Tax=Sanguibacter antarcticus TaxID=372484 RepID=A0A2A9E6Y5_9MICO|nr:phosphinothricin acetyltransferase [Sanguibacter antarcticus]
MSDDVPAMARIYDHHVRTTTATFETVPPGEALWAEKVVSIVAAGWPFLVAEITDPSPGEVGGVVGFAYVGPWRVRPAYRYTVEDTIYLDAAATGRGVGTRLLAEVLDLARAAGAREVVSVIADAETTASLALHTRLGFRTVGRLEDVGRKHDRWLGTTLLQLSLVDRTADDADADADGPEPRGQQT